jgi:hypothetical protein
MRWPWTSGQWLSLFHLLEISGKVLRTLVSAGTGRGDAPSRTGSCSSYIAMRSRKNMQIGSSGPLRHVIARRLCSLNNRRRTLLTIEEGPSGLRHVRECKA